MNQLRATPDRGQEHTMPTQPAPPPLPPAVLSPPVFRSFHDAYAAVLHDLVTHPQHHIDTRGNAGPERLNVSFQITDPAARVALLASRKTNVVFNLAEALWFLGGRDDLAMMRYYAPRMAAYSPDGLTIAGAAYGTRLFRAGGQPDAQSPFDATLDLIRSDPDTKRAVLPIFTAAEVGDGRHPDVSCTLAFQFLCRDGALHAVGYLRANDAFQGLVSDVFSFTFIQELAARLLGLKLGTYTHHVGSMHVASAKLPKVRAIVAEAANPAPALPMPCMPAETTMDAVEEIRAHEQRLRANLARHTAQSLERTGLPAYWQGLLGLLEIYRQIAHEPDARPVDPGILAVLQPAHRWLVQKKWPARIPAADSHEARPT
ncbi:thymidylate synthase [Amycolatopsis sp. WGS_07]|uniref:thymidylate synthase n=1 Tax=Amycolatopsis sp. WGS_07 TaxID=3076764 RepID=UPI00387332B8